ncbi:hypothetical protein BY458DRAFT_476725 [Sporodiniella umbellata]|nr:hypothetical protein BY458DRAFT_476725 [Sporodiniella umbellata]
MLLNRPPMQCFDTNKWSKKIKLPLKLQRTHKRNGSAMVKAAATEKYVKRRGQAEMTCEDLTASQFADITGLKKKSEMVESEDDRSDTTSTASLTIWDSHFWQNNKNHPTGLILPEPCMALEKNVSGAVQKGRFKIVWGMDPEQTQANSPKQIHCVEWKRKKNF